MAAGDIRRVEILVSVFVEDVNGVVEELALRSAWNSADEVIDRARRGLSVDGKSLPIQPQEPLRAMRRNLYDNFERIALLLGEAVSRVRVRRAS